VILDHEVTPTNGHPSRRRWEYDRRLLPNPYLAEALEPEEVQDLVTAREKSGLTIGYPAWNLLYYSLFCSLPGDSPSSPPDAVVVETGTNQGASTIVMAQALKDAGLDSVVHTVESQPELAEIAKQNVAQAGLTDHVQFNVENSLTFLTRLVEEMGHIDFIFLDDDHSFEHVVAEFEIVHPALLVRKGKAYFDNTSDLGVFEALKLIPERHGGNLVQFENCSWEPPGNAIWQPA
jgi:methyltransferase family protein